MPRCKANLKRGLQQPLYQRVLHFFLGSNCKKVISHPVAWPQPLHGVMG